MVEVSAGDAGGPPVYRGDAKLGDILRAHDWVSDEALREGLDRQLSTGERLGDLLVALGRVSRQHVTEALAEQWGLDVVDPLREPPDPALLAPESDLELYLEARLLPWRRIGGAISYLTDSPQEAGAKIAHLCTRDARPGFLVVTSPAQFDRALLSALGPGLAQRAARRVDDGLSVRSLRGLRVAAASGVVALTALAVIYPDPVLLALIAGLFVLNVATTLMRASALVAGFVPAKARQGHGKAEDGTTSKVVDLAGWQSRPRVSILVPLYREAEMVGEILRALSALDYPRELLDVKLLIEADDQETARALDRIALPGWVSILVVPAGGPKTKPRAMNLALDFCKGDIVGILDAEDRPEPDQLLRVAEALRTASPDVACVQCQLAYYNATENWITRCFHLEYSIWFNVLLRGFQRLGLPVPLGGTSVYFRRSALDGLDGWDAYNVTEDADLGMRIARDGGRVLVIESVTLEEANCRLWPWIRQRSRWLKGYLMTWLSHMRAPRRLWRELGAPGFFALNVLLLGGTVTYLMLPLFWVSVAGWLITGLKPWAGILPDAAVAPLAASLCIGQGVMLGCAVLAMWRRGTPGLLVWVPTLPLYWTLGAVAAWKAIAEMFSAPYYWDKTRHGVSRVFRRQAGLHTRP